MKWTICTAVLLAALHQVTPQRTIIPDNPLFALLGDCNVRGIINYPLQQTAEKWLEILRTRNFTAVCADISLWLNAFEGCVRLGESLVGIGLDTSAVQVYYRFNNVIKSYCNAANPTDLCDWNSVASCTTRVVLSTQETIKGVFPDDVKNICVTYGTLVGLMRSCMETATSSCDVTTRNDILSSFNNVFQYFETARDYCQSGCPDIVLFFANNYTNCRYLDINWSTLSFDQYCSYIDTTVQCTWNLYRGCPIGSPTIAGAAIDGVLIYSDLLGCNIDIDGKTVADVSNFATLPRCAKEAIDCTKGLANFVGVSQTLGPKGGYNFNGIVSKLNSYLVKLTSLRVREICSFVNEDVWQMVANCSVGIIDGCGINTPSANAARVIIADQISKYVGQACSDGCTYLQERFETIDQCDDGFNLKALTPDDGLQVLLGVFSARGADTNFCRYVRAYVGCVVNALKGCDILYQNWVALISRYSSVPYAVKICGVRVSLRTGEVDVRPDGNDVAFNVENGADYSQQFSIPLLLLSSLISALILS